MSLDPGAIRAIVEQAEEIRVEPPRPLTRQMPPADAFPVDALGDVLGAAARAIHDRVQAPLAICSQSVLAAAALAAQAHADDQLPMGHVRPVSDFFVTVAETGARKSASDTEANWPIRKREQALGETRDAELPNYVNDKTAWEKARDEAVKRGKGNRGTGPRTAGGKATSALNSGNHGLRSRRFLEEARNLLEIIRICKGTSRRCRRR